MTLQGAPLFNSMNIQFVTRTLPYPADKDGESTIAFNVLRALGEHHEVSLASFGDSKNPVAQEASDALDIPVTLVPAPRTSFFRFYASGTFRRMPWFSFRQESHAMRAVLQATDRTKDVDLVVLHSPFLAWYIPVLQRKPAVLHAIDALAPLLLRMAERARPLRALHLRREARWANRQAAQLYPKARAVIVVSDHDRQQLARSSPSAHVIAIPLGVDTEFYRPDANIPEQQELVMTGTMDYPPNVEAALWFAKSVWGSVKREHPTLRWAIVGRRPVAALRTLARHDPSITVTGDVPDIRPYLHRAAVVVAPILHASGAKNKLLEAMGCGKAIVASVAAIEGSPLRRNQHVLVADSAGEWIAVIRRLLENGQERRLLGSGARQYAEQHAWPDVARHYESAYQTLLARI